MMTSPLNIAVSAINAAFQMQAASAHNIANSNTDGYKSLDASTEESITGGVTVTISKDPQPGTSYYTSDGEEAETSNVDYARERVTQINARTLLAASIVSLQTYEEMQKSVIDIMA
jgi:flagellar basal-body rod protein FlgC